MLELARKEPEDTEGDSFMPSIEAVFDRQMEILERVSAIEAIQKQIAEHLRVLNGTTARTVDRVTEIEKHPMTCEAKAAVAAIQVAKAAEDKESARWQGWLRPIIWTLLVFLLGIFLGHADFLMNLLKGNG